MAASRCLFNAMTFLLLVMIGFLMEKSKVYINKDEKSFIYFMAVVITLEALLNGLRMAIFDLPQQD